MITLASILILWFIVTTVRIYRKSPKFDLLSSKISVIDGTVFCYGVAIIIGFLIYLCVKYLP